MVHLIYRISVQIFRDRKIYKEAMRQFRQDAPSQNYGNRPYEQQSQTRESQTRKRNADGKIFSKDEGEYVDFEEI